MADFKLLDPRRKAVLSLPDPAFKLWMTYWFFESDDQEAYPSLERLEAVSGQARKTVIKWRKYLLDTGWLVRLTGFASDRYSKPTRGSHSVAVYRVDDPAKDGKGVPRVPIQVVKGGRRTPIEDEKGVSHTPFPADEEKGCTTSTPPEIHPRFIPVSMSLPVPKSVAVPTSVSADADGTHQSLRDSNATATANATAKTRTKTTTMTSGATLRHNAKYDAPFPYDFDTWSQVDRTAWCVEHTRKSVEPSVPSSPEATPPPNSAAPPPTRKKGQCPHCVQVPGESGLTRHIRRAHPEILLGVGCDRCDYRNLVVPDDAEGMTLARDLLHLHLNECKGEKPKQERKDN